MTDSSRRMFRRTEFASVARVSAKAKKYIYVGAVSFPPQEDFLH